MRVGSRLGRLCLFLIAVGAGVSVLIATADRYLWPRVAWQQERYDAVADYLRAHSLAQDRIFVWGNSPEIYLYARRRMATRYMSVNYQTGHVWGTPANDLGGKPDLAHVPVDSWDKLIADLEHNRPLFIIDAAAGRLAKMDDEPIARHPRMAAFVKQSYDLAATVLGVPIYRLRGSDDENKANSARPAEEQRATDQR